MKRLTDGGGSYKKPSRTYRRSETMVRVMPRSISKMKSVTAKAMSIGKMPKTRAAAKVGKMPKAKSMSRPGMPKARGMR